MIDTQALVLDNLRAAAKELPECKAHLVAVSTLARLMKRAIEIHLEETRELVRINEEHGKFIELHFKDLSEVMTHPRRREMAEIMDKIGEIEP
jgi:hypothetical protein